MALTDWLEAGVSIANAWGQQPVSQVFGYAGPAQTGPTPTILAPAPGQMGDNGQWVPTGKRRRRRRPCLTQTDINILYQIGNLPNNANVRTALARCIK